MSITSVDTTNVTVKCPEDQVETVFALASLEAGYDKGEDGVAFEPLDCGHSQLLIRTYRNATENAGAINGLHENDG